MSENRPGGSAEWSDPDDAPELTSDMLADAELFEGDRFVRRGPGRPASGRRKEAINIRLDADVLAAFRAGGPGWQTRLNAVLRAQTVDAPGASGDAGSDRSGVRTAGAVLLSR